MVAAEILIAFEIVAVTGTEAVVAVAAAVVVVEFEHPMLDLLQCPWSFAD